MTGVRSRPRRARRPGRPGAAGPWPPIPVCSRPRRFRLGVPSCVYPAGLLANVEALAPRVEDIELAFFETHPAADPASPDRGELRRLAELARRHAVSYTVHLPLDRALGSPDPAERAAVGARMRDLIARTRPLRPWAYVLHLAGVRRDSAPARVAAWRRDVAEALPALCEAAGDPGRLCVETLDYPFAWCAPLLDAFGLGVCLDVGHLWAAGADPVAHLDRFRARTRVVHLHGVRGARDHLPLTVLPPARLRAARAALDAFDGVVTLELFRYEALRDSIEALNAVRPGRGARAPRARRCSKPARAARRPRRPIPAGAP